MHGIVLIDPAISTARPIRMIWKQREGVIGVYLTCYCKL